MRYIVVARGSKVLVSGGGPATRKLLLPGESAQLAVG
jgi:hypothetical protein